MKKNSGKSKRDATAGRKADSPATHGSASQWCEHISRPSDSGIRRLSTCSASIGVCADWTYCPVCGKPKPQDGQTDRHITVKETRGGLMYLVTWQSLDGRPSHNYYDTLAEAHKQCAWLRSLGRTGMAWANVTSPNAERSDGAAPFAPATGSAAVEPPQKPN